MWELAGVGLVGAMVGAGAHSAYVTRAINECHQRADAETYVGNDRYTGGAFNFAKCMSPSRYDPMYDYNRFKGK